MGKNIEGIGSLKILIIDDSEIVLSMLTNTLHAIGVKNITTANSVQSALVKFPLMNKTVFNVIFLDRYIGTESGLDILKNLKERQVDIPVIMLTQEDEASKVMESIRLGAVDYIVKPFTEEVILQKLERVVGPL